MCMRDSSIRKVIRRKRPTFSGTRLASVGVGQPRYYFIPSTHFFLFSKACRLAVGPTQPPVLWVLEDSPHGMQLTTFMASSAKVKNVCNCTSRPSQCAQKPFYLYLACTNKHDLGIPTPDSVNQYYISHMNMHVACIFLSTDLSHAVTIHVAFLFQFIDIA